MDLSPFSLQINEQYNSPVRQQMKFTRMKDGKEINVGTDGFTQAGLSPVSASSMSSWHSPS